MTASDQVTAAEAAEVLGVPRGLISVWKSRGRVVPVAELRPSRTGGRPVPLYAIDELRPLAQEYHDRAETRATRRARVIRLARGIE